jgi:hypothetical protein
MGRKFRSTEISGTMNSAGDTGQHNHWVYFCINCHKIGDHYPECTNPESYAIMTTAEVPKKNASKKKWEIFMKQFVYAKPTGWWAGEPYCWWNIHNRDKKYKTVKLPHTNITLTEFQAGLLKFIGEHQDNCYISTDNVDAKILVDRDILEKIDINTYRTTQLGNKIIKAL